MHIDVICFICLCVYCMASVDESAFSLTFSDDLQSWCPHSEFCGLEPTQRLDPALKNTVPCCGSCSCSDDCGKYRNCCTSSMDRYKIDDTLRTVCKSLIANWNNTDMEKQQLFDMVDKCPNFSEGCVDQHTSMMGSYHPVYSSETNLIYYNSKCAECHNQRDVAPFEAAIRCSAKKESYTNVLYVVMIGNTHDSDCLIQFVPPNDIDMRTQVCYPMKKSDCSPESRFYAMRDRCASFNATYRTPQGTFGNIYCYICNSVGITIEEAEMKVNLNTMCDADETSKFWGKHAFTVLINHETFDSASSARDNEEHQWCEAACSVPSKEVHKSCRAMHCPVGQYRTHDGCKILGDKWFADAISVNFILTPQTKVLVEEIEDLIDRNNHSSSEAIFLQRNVFQSWKLRLLFKSEASGGFIQHFVAQVFYVSVDMSINPVTLLQMVESSLNQPWRIVFLGKRYDLTSTLDINYGYRRHVHKKNGSVSMLYAPTWLIYWSSYAFNRQIERNQLLKEVFDSIERFPDGVVVISKLFFCEQVELLPAEYIAKEPNIYLLKQGKYLERGVYTQYGKIPVYRVCVSEFQGQKSSSYGQETSLFFSMLCHFLYILSSV